MPQNPPADMPRLSPYIFYEDVDAAVAWLGRVFGFVERSEERMETEAERAFHSAMHLEDAVILVGHPGPDYRSPKHHGRVCQIHYVYVDDIDAHHAQALACGAKILAPPEDTFYGDRRYHVEDLEGHHWNFATRVRDVPASERRPQA